jgi:TonB-linked SusC/RagA family outer membrane protein
MPISIQPRPWLLSGLCLVGLWQSLPTTSAQVLASSRALTRTAQQRTPVSSSPMLLREALLLLMQERKVEILFDERLLGTRRTAAVRQPGATVGAILTNLLAGSGLTFNRLRTNTYLIVEEAPQKPGNPSDAGSPPLPPQEGNAGIPPAEGTRPGTDSPTERQPALDRTLTGRVVSETNEGLPGVSVVLKGTPRGTTTNAEGRFSLNIPDGPGATLVFSYVGYVTQEITVGSQSVIDVKLATDAQALSEVVVVGYGTVRRSDLTGSVTSVKAEDLARSTVTSLDQGLAGRAAGVQVTQQSGQPGGATSVRIRGISSINSANEPLYVIDGFPYYNDNSGTTSNVISGAPAQNMLSTLNPGDIESVEILKDASATAIYGARGANGVILITTKRGRAGKARIEVDAYTGVQEVIKIIPLLNARQYAEFRNENFINLLGLNGRGLPTYTDAEVAALGEGTNWQREIFRVAPMQSLQVSASGGNDNLRYSVSGSYLDQQGIVIGTDLRRYTGRVNLDAQLSKRLKLGNNFTISYIASNVGRTGGGTNGVNGVQVPTAGNIIQDALFFNPVIPVYDANGNFTLDNASGTIAYANGPGNKGNTPNANPVAVAALATQQNFTTRLLDNIFAEYTLLPSLTFRSSFGIDYLYNRQNSFIPSTLSIGIPGGNGAVGTANTLSWLTENTLNFSQTRGTHSFQALAGFSTQRYQTEYLAVSGRDFPTDVINVYNIGSAAIQNPPSTGFVGWSLLSYLGRVNYAFRDRYLFTASIRADGSSKFGANNKFGYFPSAAFAWKLHEEAFVKNLNAFSELKLRLSAGRTGNQEIPAYQSLSTLGVVRFPNTNTAQAIGLAPTRLGNPDIRWESTSQYDAGVDVGLFNNRLQLTVDAYYRKTNDLLLFVQLPFSSGFENALQNIGAVQNKGLELSLQTVNLNKTLTWRTNFNLALNRNKVLDFGNETERYIGADYNLTKGQALGVIRVGEPLGNFVGFINDGIFKTQEEVDRGPKSGFDYVGSRRFVDLNNDGRVNDDDRAIIGNALPKFTGGLQNSFSYKNINLDFFFQFVYGNEVYNMTQLELEFLNGRQNQSITALDRFQAGVNEDTDVARTGGYVNVRQTHSRWVEDGSFVRLKNVTLSYDLPLTRWNVRGLTARLYANGQNLWLLSKYRGYDPEVNINPQSNTLLGFDYTSYPSAKLYTFGLKVGF